MKLEGLKEVSNADGRVVREEAAVGADDGAVELEAEAEGDREDEGELTAVGDEEEMSEAVSCLLSCIEDVLVEEEDALTEKTCASAAGSGRRLIS